MISIVKDKKDLTANDIESLAALCIDTELADKGELETNTLSKKLADSIIRNDVYFKLIKGTVTPISRIYCYHEDDYDCICKRASILLSMRDLYSSDNGYRQAVCRMFYPDRPITIREDGVKHINIGPGARTDVGMIINNLLNVKSDINTLTNPFLRNIEVFKGISEGNSEIINCLDISRGRTAVQEAAFRFVDRLPASLIKEMRGKNIGYYGYTLKKDVYHLEIDPDTFEMCEAIEAELSYRAL